jgi:hypothetical protein
MNAVRRGLLGFMGSLLVSNASGAGGQKAQASSVKPRHVLCCLGGAHALALLSEAAEKAVRDFATGFSVDHTYSQDKPDKRMERSFGVSWDRVQPDAWSPADEKAVLDHQSVLYVLSPPMTQDNAVTISATALLVVDRLTKAGATAIKGESAGVAHGLARWNELVLQSAAALKSNDDIGLRRICRLAFAKRPLAGDVYLESVGYHLVGLPEVYIPKSRGTDREGSALMDTVADEIARNGLAPTLKARSASLSFKTDYAEDDFKFNPYGIVKLRS